MLPTYKIYLDDWYTDTEVYGKVINWNDACKLNDLHSYPRARVTGHFILAAVHFKDSVLFPYVVLETHLHMYSHIPELTSDQVDQLIFIHSLNQ